MRDGVLFVATGAGYRTLAARAAASVARVSPGLPIDLWTDAPFADPAFAEVHLLENVWFRSRIDAMARTRFERTLHLDADVLAVADLGDVFEVCSTASTSRSPTTSAATARRQRAPGAARCQRLPAVQRRRHRLPRDAGSARLLAAWAEALRASGLKRNQPVLRGVLWESDLRIATLPPEYNLLGQGQHRPLGPLPDRTALRPPLPLPQAPRRAAGARSPTIADLLRPMSPPPACR